MPTIFEVRKDHIVKLMTENAKGVGAFKEHLLIIPVRITKSTVETRFLARRTTDIVRSTARKTDPPLRPFPGSDPLLFGNLKLTLGLETVRARERGAENHLNDIVWEVLEISPGRAKVSLTTPSGIFSYLPQLNHEQELNIRDILDKINEHERTIRGIQHTLDHGDARERVDDL